MNLQQNIRILKGIAKKISNKLHCDRHGSCVHFAEIFVEEVNDKHPELLNDFDVIEGYVNAKFGNGIPQEHTWIRLNNGDIIDTTFSQFDKYDKNAQYSKKRTKVYSGQEYYDEGKEGSWFSERRKKLPSSVFKEGKRESIKRILKEESLKQSLIDMIKDGDFNFAVDIVGEDEFKRILNIETPIDYLHLFDDMEVVKSKKDSDFQLFRYKNQENLMVYHIPTRIVFVSYQLFKNVLFFTEGKETITRETETSVLSYIKQWMNEVYRLKYVVGVNAMPNKYKIMEGHSKENVLKEELNESKRINNTDTFQYLIDMEMERMKEICYEQDSENTTDMVSFDVCDLLEYAKPEVEVTGIDNRNDNLVIIVKIKVSTRQWFKDEESFVDELERRLKKWLGNDIIEVEDISFK